MNLEMVFSAPAMLRFQRTNVEISFPEAARRRAEMLRAYLHEVKAQCSNVVGFPFGISMLYNAYTEPSSGQMIRDSDFGFDYLYADSGGLQAVTQNIKVDDAFKHNIYREQAKTDFAFCFDEIPCRDMERASRSANGGKLYFPDEARACAIKTAHNINEQIETIRSINDHTKVFYIVQGNTIDDMVEWVKAGWDIVQHKERIAGFALADTCMGNDVLESIDMLIAYAKIAEMTGNRYNRLHLLGVGSASRLSPAINFIKSGIINKDTIVSFDSSSLSLNWIFGGILTEEGKIPFNDDVGFETNLLPRLHTYFDFVSPYVECERDEVMQHFRENYMSMGRIHDCKNNSEMLIAARTMATMLHFEQTIALCKQITQAPATPFAKAHTIDEAMRIRDTLITQVPSKRIQRFTQSLSDFFI